MGQIVKKVSENRTRYTWYPGEKKEWIRAAWALAVGAAAYGALALGTHRTLLAVVTGTSLTAALAGFNLGRRDFRATRDFPELEAVRPVRPRDSDTARRPRAVVGRRAAAAHAGRAVWRGLVAGVGGGLAAVLVANLAAQGFLANWVLPVVPAAIGALAHQGGMLYERLGRAGKPADLPLVPPTQARTREWPGSYGDSGTTVADTHSPNTPTSTTRPNSTLDGR